MSSFKGTLPCLTTLDLGELSELTVIGLQRILEHTGPAFKTLNFELEYNRRFSVSILEYIKHQYPNVNFSVYYGCYLI